MTGIAVVDQRDRPVFQLARPRSPRRGCSSEFLELQRAFHRQGVGGAPARGRGHLAPSAELAGEMLDGRLALDRLPPSGPAPRSARLTRLRLVRLGLIVPRARPIASARQARTASWQVKALVEATPISGPAFVRRDHVALTCHRRGRDIDDRDESSGHAPWRSGGRRACPPSRPIATRRASGRPARHRHLGVAELGRHLDRDREAWRSARTSISRSAPPCRPCRRR